MIENIRYMLYQYKSQTSLYLGNRFTASKPEVGHFEGYMSGGATESQNNLKFIILSLSGGGSILSKKALKKLVKNIIPKNPPNCQRDWLKFDDLFTGKFKISHIFSHSIL